MKNPFGEIAEEYDQWYHKHKIIFQNELDTIKSYKPRGRSLEIGVGTRIFASRLGIAVGIDPSKQMLKKAKRRAMVVRAIGEALPFKYKSFDFILMTTTLSFLKDEEETILQTQIALRENGRLLICIIERNSQWGRRYIEKGKSGDSIYKYAKFKSTEDVKKLLKRTGFKVKRIKATLSFKPNEKPRREEPSKNYRGRGYVCIEAEKQ